MGLHHYAPPLSSNRRYLYGMFNTRGSRLSYSQLTLDSLDS